MTYAPPYAFLEDVYNIPDREEEEQPQPIQPIQHIPPLVIPQRYIPQTNIPQPIQLIRRSPSSPPSRLPDIPTPSLGWSVLYLALVACVSVGLL